MRGAIITLFISATIALLPIYNRVSSFNFERTAKDNLLMILIGLFAIMFKDTKRSFPVAGWIVLGIALFLNVFNQHNVISINVMIQSFYISAAMLFFVRLYECFDASHENLILNGMCAGALIQSVYVAFTMLGINLELATLELFNGAIKSSDQSPKLWGAVGTLGNSNLFAGYMALCCMSFLREKWIYWLPIPLACLVLSGSAMGIGAFIGGVGFYIVQKYVNWAYLYLLAVVSMFLVYFTGLNGMDSGRFEIWKELFNRYDYQTLIGHGPGWFPDQKIVWSGTHVVQEHSLYLSIVSVFGLIGLMAFCFLVCKAARTTNKLMAAILFTILLNGYGHFSLHQSTMVIIIICVVVICLIKEEKNEFI